MGWHVIFAWQACTTRMAIHKHVFMLALLHAQGRYASRAWLLFAASRRRAAQERERRSAGARTLDRPDRLDDDDDGNDDDYNDKRIMVDDGPPRYTWLTAKQRRMLL